MNCWCGFLQLIYSHLAKCCILSTASVSVIFHPRQAKQSSTVSVYRRNSQEALIRTYLFITLPASCPQATLIVFTVKFYCVNYLEVCDQKISPVCLYLEFYLAATHDAYRSYKRTRRRIPSMWTKDKVEIMLSSISIPNPYVSPTWHV